MVDCGEGTQLQMRKSSLSFTKLGHVFISHFHGDHCFGLIGMISTFGLLGRTATLNIYAPEALNDILEKQIAFFCRDLGYEVKFHTVDTKCHQVIYEDRSLTVETVPLQHRPSCCGYIFREKPTLPHIKRDMIDFYQIPVSQINNIKNGQGYTLPDGTYIEHERLVTEADKPRSYAYCSDTRYMPRLHEMISGVDTLYHESTYAHDKLESAAKYCHSTAAQAAQVARDAHAGKLLLGHYSARYADENILLEEAKKVFDNSFLTNEMDIFDVK